MTSVEILRPRLRGRRFENGAIPLEFLGDLAHLREMILEVAKWRFLNHHADRLRVPRGFASAVEFQLTGLERGSAVPVISIATPQSTLAEGLPYEQHFTGAVESIIETIDATNRDSLPSSNGYLPPKYLAHFNRIGRSLREDEFIQLQAPSVRASARLDQRTRLQLLQIANVRELSQELTIRGAVSEVDQDDMTFDIHPIFGRKVSGTIPEQHYEAFMEAFNGYREGVRVSIEGVGKYDQQRRLTALQVIEQINILDPLDVPSRLDEFRNMRDGWLDGEGIAPARAGLDWLAESFERCYPDDAPLPFTYPTPSGGVQFEWSTGGQEISIEVDLRTRQSVWHRLDMSTLSDDERELDLESAASWKWIGAQVVQFSEQAG